MRLKFVSLFGKYYGGPKVFGFLKIHEGIADDDNRITHLNLAGSSTDQTDATTATLTLDDVGFQAFAIIIITIFTITFLFRGRIAPSFKSKAILSIHS